MYLLFKLLKKIYIDYDNFNLLNCWIFINSFVKIFHEIVKKITL